MTVRTDVLRGAPPVAIPRSAVWTVRNRDGQVYELRVAWPAEPPAAPGYPVIYLLDANATFATVVETIRLRARRPDATGVVPAVVVGIAYPTDAAYDVPRRAHDFTPDRGRTTIEMAQGSRGRPGGADAFRRFLEDEVKPAVRAALPVDPHRQTLFGHSLGGLFVLHTLLQTPQAYDTYVAVSPSIWWDREGLAEAIDVARASAASPLRTARVLITVGEYEQELAPWQREDPSSDVARRRRERRMVDDARDLSVRLSDLVRQVAFALLPEEDHASTVTVSISKSLRFCLHPSASERPGGEI